MTREGLRERGYATVIGDLLQSRRSPQRRLLQARLRDAIGRTHARVPALQSLRLTIGDEFQGVYQRLGDALNATLLVRLLLRDTAGVRFGIGWGALTAWSPERPPYEQDGPAWWAARAALDAVRDQERRPGTPEGWSTAVRRHAGEAPRVTPEPDTPTLFPTDQYLVDSVPLSLDTSALLDGVVMFRDHVTAMLDERDVALVLALLDGATVTGAAAEAGISQQAASKRLRVNGGYSLLRSWELLEAAHR